ncbi:MULTISPECIES: cobalt-precorrin-5B (C(1))-methyltransferase CbiD [Cyanophyceae]|uniref:cobalt-precorrin-5B (C(1))-methyltransferase CbiD n=1 Tax=Cyanophyceae TaxID=3028117 RepID=UPI001686BA9C|nr:MULTISPECIES: cobalt-precorrin-5B (C(1))-methyltransferase CbiD [Cyanophyceae]MBD1918481.1 cobalt-precorrin-5B (C(1))-methyltransferase [Phormidium sp. FACHB-77]MBD2031370.1 cobalt-precorrin-5B (C(1))-methyltransferase [Phormidium sp. FACHB-322]MBD2049490.1 cobalt-precorrin-5B (C(1))-methyltransferase [Leptolyngbya sp. FACHB-60]
MSSATSSPRSGHTLPVFACAGAIAALKYLLNASDRPQIITLDLLNPPQPADIPIAQLAPLPNGSVLAITHSDPGDNLDLTRYTPLWSVVAWGDDDQTDLIQLEGGEGIGKQLEQDGAPAIYRYAKALITHNLTPLIPSGKTLRVTIILPEGRALAERTSNAAFGVVEGLSLLGTAGISEPLSAPGQLDQSREILRDKAAHHAHLVFCLGENGLDLALKLGINPDCRVKTANWLGPMLVEAGHLGVAGVLLLGYHGKLIKLAGGIFHTHHHVADGRQEILAACCVGQDVPLSIIQRVLQAETVEAGLGILREFDGAMMRRVYQHIVERIDERAAAYVHAHTGRALTVGSMVFDRQRQIVARSDRGQTLINQVLID